MEVPLTPPALDTLAIGWPITRLGVSFFPVFLAGNELPVITTGEASGLVVDELDEPSVPALRVRNLGDKPVLVVEGEHFLGGKQNGTVNATVRRAAPAGRSLQRLDPVASGQPPSGGACPDLQRRHRARGVLHARSGSCEGRMKSGAPSCKQPSTDGGFRRAWMVR